MDILTDEGDIANKSFQNIYTILFNKHLNSTKNN